MAGGAGAASALSPLVHPAPDRAFTSATTPTICAADRCRSIESFRRQPAGGRKRTRECLVDHGDRRTRRRSRSSKMRPSRTGMRNAVKYSGLIQRQSTERGPFSSPPAGGPIGRFKPRSIGMLLDTATARSPAHPEARESLLKQRDRFHRAPASTIPEATSCQ